MPIIKSAKKRVKVAAKANVRNSKTKRTLREAVKSFTKTVSAGNAAEIAKAQKAVMSAIDTAVKKNVIQKNRAARKKAQIAAQAKAAGMKITKSVKKVAAKSPVKKTAAKPAAKKAPAKKKPAARK